MLSLGDTLTVVVVLAKSRSGIQISYSAGVVQAQRGGRPDREKQTQISIRMTLEVATLWIQHQRESGFCRPDQMSYLAFGHLFYPMWRP